MTYKQIETSREFRLWITGILGPVIIGAATIIANNPELRDTICARAKSKVEELKAKVRKKE